MNDSNKLKQLRTTLQNYSLLYVENNPKLNAQLTELFKKFFGKVFSAFDGPEGLQMFEQNRPQVVVSDINLPQMNGLEMVRRILVMDSETKIIITSAHDEAEYLHQAIRIGVFDYLPKPLQADELMQVLSRCSVSLTEALHRKIFNANLHAIFNYQNNLVLLLHGRNVVMANERCLAFFGIPSMEAFRKQFSGFGEELLEHNNFLYNHDNVEWFSHLINHPGKLFNVKIADAEENSHHFILSFQVIPEKEGYSVLSLNDVTELQLLKLYDSNAMEREKAAKDAKAVRGLLEMAMQSAAKVKVHNFYRGLGITNEGLIIDVARKGVLMNTSYVQIKAMQLEKQFYLTSELFPMAMFCEGIKETDLDKQTVFFDTFRLVPNSPTMRESIRIVPDEQMKVTVLYEGRKFDTDMDIMDVSTRGMKLEFLSLPAGFALNQSALLDIVITMGQRPFIINTRARVFRIAENNRRFEVVFVYDLNTQAQKHMIEYIAKRQMSLIREFKGLQYER